VLAEAFLFVDIKHAIAILDRYKNEDLGTECVLRAFALILGGSTKSEAINLVDKYQDEIWATEWDFGEISEYLDWGTTRGKLNTVVVQGCRDLIQHLEELSAGNIKNKEVNQDA
jgi:hypothetical protein